MNDENRFVQKIDALDLILSILRDHEERLDELVSRLEQLDYLK